MISYITTAIPYVNARPHLGHALELVQTDVLARHRRLRGHTAQLLTGTDDNASKNVAAAAAAAVPVEEFVRVNGDAFLGLADRLAISADDRIRTASDPRHLPAVHRLWSAISDDLYLRSYRGWYCPGCEQFYQPEELSDGLCPEHRTQPDDVIERNWFFALSTYQQRIEQLVESGAVLVQPDHRRTEVLSFIRSGLKDFSVSRPRSRSGGWGIPVPGDPDQTVYVWADALINYVSAAGYGNDPDRYRRLWVSADERLHVIGKGISRFHAVYWLGLLLAAGEPLPTRIAIHEYLQADGRKIAKSASIDRSARPATPEDLLDRYGRDAVRWWLTSDVTPVGDTDFSEDRLRDRYTQDLANTIGNLVNRTVTLVRRGLGGHLRVRPGQRVSASPARTGCPELVTSADLARGLPDAVDRALDAFDHRRACRAIVAAAAASNAAVEASRPWRLVKPSAAGDSAASEQLNAILATLSINCHVIATELQPFIPDGAARLLSCLGDTPENTGAPYDLTVGPAEPAFEVVRT